MFAANITMLTTTAIAASHNPIHAPSAKWTTIPETPIVKITSCAYATRGERIGTWVSAGT